MEGPILGRLRLELREGRLKRDLLWSNRSIFNILMYDIPMDIWIYIIIEISNEALKINAVLFLGK